MSSPPPPDEYALAPNGSATTLALSRLMSATATILPPDSSVVMRSACARPMPPAPMSPIRTVMVISATEWVGCHLIPRPQLARYSRIAMAFCFGKEALQG